jgi:O-antigen/teichoic acid export membrane protein
MVIGVVAGIILSKLNTTMLGPALYGDFKFVQNLFTFAQTFLTIGIFYSGGRIIAFQKDPEKRREFYGTIIIYTAIISLALIIVGGIFSFFEEGLFGNNLKWVILACLPLAFVFPLQLYTYFEYKLILNLEIFLLSMAIPMILIILWLKPKFNCFKSNTKLLWKENKTYGNPVYIGAITGVASAQIASFSLSYFVDNVNVGFFALAITATTPLAMLPVAFGTTLFKDFVSLPKIPAKVVLYTLIMGICTLALFQLVIGFLIRWIFLPEFAPVINLCYITAIGSTLHGFGDFINRFISAKGKGKVLRNSNFILGILNVAGYIGLVYLWGIKGAAVTKLVAGFAYMLNMLYFYFIIIRKRGDNE